MAGITAIVLATSFAVSARHLSPWQPPRNGLQTNDRSILWRPTAVSAAPLGQQVEYPAMKLGSAGSVAERLQQCGPMVRARLAPLFRQQEIAYPPRRLALVGFKQEHVLEVYAANGPGPMRLIRIYPILAESGVLGPKLQYGDHQVPEGIYGVSELNPNSRFHLALRVSYPNAFDVAEAIHDKRTNLGGNIMIHGHDTSVGCLAMGDAASEDLFVLTADTGPQNTEVILSPMDFRRTMTTRLPIEVLPWRTELYRQIYRALLAL